MSKPNANRKKDGADKQDSLPNIWARAGDRNPYLHNVFALLGIDPDGGERAFQRKVHRAEKRLEAGKTIAVHGREIEETDIAHAKYLLANAVHFVAERLLFHTVHKVDGEVFDKHIDALESIDFQRPETLLPLPIRDLTMLTELLPDLDEVAGDEPAPPSVERFHDVVAPRAEEEQILDW